MKKVILSILLVASNAMAFDMTVEANRVSFDSYDNWGPSNTLIMKIDNRPVLSEGCGEMGNVHRMMTYYGQMLVKAGPRKIRISGEELCYLNSFTVTPIKFELAE